MATSTSCPTCGRAHAPPAGGGRIKCVQCDTLFSATPPVPRPATTKAPSAQTATGTAPVSIEKTAPAGAGLAFWVGVAALSVGLIACCVSFFPGVVGFTRILGWLGVLLGGGSVVLALLNDDYNFSFPFAGLATSLLALAILLYWTAPASGPRRGRGWGPGFNGGGWTGNPNGKGGRGRRGGQGDGNNNAAPAAPAAPAQAPPPPM